MTRSEIFKAAHKLAKTFVGSYVACFALALKSVYKSIKEKVVKTAKQIADALNEQGYKYYGERAKGWESADGKVQRIYFGRDYVTIEDGKAHANKAGKTRAQTIGSSAVSAVSAVI